LGIRFLVLYGYQLSDNNIYHLTLLSKCFVFLKYSVIDGLNLNQNIYNA